MTLNTVEEQETQPTVSFPTLDNFLKDPASYIANLGLDSPVVVLITLYLSKKVLDFFNRSTSSIVESLWFSQRKDEQINNLLQLLRESFGCDRVILGLICNGEKAVGEAYHIRKLVITHESCAANISSAIKGREHRFSLSVLDRESRLYDKDKDWVMAKTNSSDALDAACRRYLDSIDVQTIFTLKMMTKVKGKFVEVGYLSFQWRRAVGFNLQGKVTLDSMLRIRWQKDLLYFQNQIMDIVLSSQDRRGFVNSLKKLLTVKSNLI